MGSESPRCSHMGASIAEAAPCLTAMPACPSHTNTGDEHSFCCAVLHALGHVLPRPVLSCAGGVLVHCLAGMSRSASICIAYIMWKQRLSYADVSVGLAAAVQHAFGWVVPGAQRGRASSPPRDRERGLWAPPSCPCQAP